VNVTSFKIPFSLPSSAESDDACVSSAVAAESSVGAAQAHGEGGDENRTSDETGNVVESVHGVWTPT
jgi:hypothetical protein